MKNKIAFLPLVLGFFMFTYSCGEDEEPLVVDCSTVTYGATIKSIVANSCSNASCHGTNAPNGDYTTYDGIKDVATNGKMMTEVVNQQSMPIGSSLTEEQIAQVKCWLDAGAPDN